MFNLIECALCLKVHTRNISILEQSFILSVLLIYLNKYLICTECDIANTYRMFQLKIFLVSKQDASTSEDHSEVHLNILSFL